MSDKDIVWEHKEIVKGSKRTVEAHGTRRGRIRLTPNQQQAASDIEIAYGLEASGWGYALLGAKTMNLGRVGSGRISQDRIDKIRKRIGRLNEWEFQEKKQIRNTVKMLSIKDITTKEYGEFIGVSSQTVSNWYKEGLDNYARLFF